jgi:dTDP-4-dehydrorhamnose 3,5-epimerase
MNVREFSIAGLKLIEPQVFGDSRGFFLEAWNKGKYEEFGIPSNFVQDNLSFSQGGVLRGLHFQNPAGQGKLVSVLQGEVFDVAVDIRKGSKTFGQWQGVFLSGENRHQFWIPAGFAHGFLVCSEAALFTYKCDEFYSPETEYGIRWDDPEIGIEWPEVGKVLLSEKDQRNLFLKDLPEGAFF